MNSSTTETIEIPRHVKRAQKPHRPIRSRILQGVLILIATSGAALVGISLFAPSVAGELYGLFLDAERGATRGMVEAGLLDEPVSIATLAVPSGATGTPGPQADFVGSSYMADAAGEYLPTVYLGPLANEAVMDACDGTFTELESYRGDPAVLPVYAAHNSCGGDTILDVGLGEKVRAVTESGSVQTFVVTDTRDVAKHGSTTQDLEGMAGTISLQTCYYGSPEMRFLALTPVS